MPEHLFVYGTLRAESAHPMAHRLRVGARHIGKGRAPGLLYDFGSWPGAFFALEEKYRVIGSVFALGPNPRLLSDLDKYEGVVPTDEEREFPESRGTVSSHRHRGRISIMAAASRLGPMR